MALELFGVPKDLAVSYSLLTWLIQMLTNIGLAGIFVARQDLSVREMLETEEQAAAVVRQEG